MGFLKHQQLGPENGWLKDYLTPFGILPSFQVRLLLVSGRVAFQVKRSVGTW